MMIYWIFCDGVLDFSLKIVFLIILIGGFSEFGSIGWFLMILFHED